MTEGLWKSFIILKVTNDDRIYNELQNYPWVKLTLGKTTPG
jgi:hypothetical protein